MRASAAILIALICGGLLAAPARAGEPRKDQADKILVLKSERRLILFRDRHVLRAYRVALGFNPTDPKQRAGDGRTPEGSYVIDARNAKSSYYRSLHISYPSPADRARAHELGFSPGGDIMIHGLPNGLEEIDRDHASSDWTDGCVAVTNGEIDEIWELVKDGTPIEIRP